MSTQSILWSHCWAVSSQSNHALCLLCCRVVRAMNRNAASAINDILYMYVYMHVMWMHAYTARVPLWTNHCTVLWSSATIFCLPLLEQLCFTLTDQNDLHVMSVIAIAGSWSVVCTASLCMYLWMTLSAYMIMLCSETVVLHYCLLTCDMNDTWTITHCWFTQKKDSVLNVNHMYSASYCATFCNTVDIHCRGTYSYCVCVHVCMCMSTYPSLLAGQTYV